MTFTEDEHTVVNGVIKDPGKFEGEEPWVPTAYDTMLNGWNWNEIWEGCEENDEIVPDHEAYGVVGDYFLLSKEEEDWKTFGVPENTFALVLGYSDQGFVRGYLFESEEKWLEYKEEKQSLGLFFS